MVQLDTRVLSASVHCPAQGNVRDHAESEAATQTPSRARGRELVHSVTIQVRVWPAVGISSERLFIKGTRMGMVSGSGSVSE